MDEIKDVFLQWLRDAHAAETQALSMLKSQAERLESYPELRARIQQHHAETEAQLRALDAVLDRYGTDASIGGEGRAVQLCL